MNRNTVKNRAPAPIQITAEQLLREAKEKKLEEVDKAPKQFITDKEELLLYQQTKRKDFEDQIRRQRQHVGIWLRYALWEASQKEFERSRSVFERALDVDYRNQTTWFKYIEMEMKAKFVNHARNLYDRAVQLLPRVDIFWLKYAYMEELIGAIENCRQVFERFMRWEPDDNGWAAYIKFEMRQGEIGRARGLYERYVACHPTSRAYLKYAHWEEKQQQRVFTRQVYERSLEEIHPSERSEKLLINFARFEERCHEYDRARMIYKYAIEQLGQGELGQDAASDELKQEFASFEKRHGSRKDIESAIVQKRREQYELLIKADTYDYDHWFDYIRLEETEGSVESAREVYERAIANIPLVAEKRYWARYVYLWLYYAIFEELEAKDVERTRSVFKAALSVVPHKKFTFGKLWLAAAHFEVRQKDLGAARKLLGRAIGQCPKQNLFKGYLELELQLGEVDRCRSIYAKYLETMPHNVSAWKGFCQLETNVGETERARAIYELAVSQQALDMPELLWKAYIDFEIAECEAANVRALYERLLERSGHVKVWISYGQFESSELGEGITHARSIFEKGYSALKELGLKEERLLLLEAWKDCESSCSGADPSDEQALVRGVGDVSIVDAKLPKKIKMRRMAKAEDGTELGWEEYYDYHFPDDERKIVGLKILENAMKWKAAMAGGAEASSSSSSSDAHQHIGNDDSVLGKRKSGLASSEEINIDDDE